MGYNIMFHVANICIYFPKITSIRGNRGLEIGGRIYINHFIVGGGGNENRWKSAIQMKIRKNEKFKIIQLCFRTSADEDWTICKYVS